MMANLPDNGIYIDFLLKIFNLFLVSGAIFLEWSEVVLTDS